ncbi:UNVERIFIED_CONTAM: hypothetical protein HDU68_001140, partial [Siphonaria sp. JEL0065]
QVKGRGTNIPSSSRLDKYFDPNYDPKLDFDNYDDTNLDHYVTALEGMQKRGFSSEQDKDRKRKSKKKKDKKSKSGKSKKEKKKSGKKKHCDEKGVGSSDESDSGDSLS